LRRFGRDILAGVARGKKKKHGPIPKGNGSGSRRRMDRTTERRLAVLKRWRAKRSRELGLDPGVLCPNSALEAIAWCNPERAEELEEASDLKGWFVREFGTEVTSVLAEADPQE
jgi:ribonuclease D